ncbi:lamin tail domain-containing protein [Agrococcus jejuensis]|uniref:LPXTG-motif cell wall anchor domain-containing protein n=1 Tax=Agrococcus jejuensis TaxID=399736 RepID=A0A1G8BFJ5_9MICO|nr:lamin tail domain-containing protein [Agrococcus jejuensis]SDH31938.1 LPXTG-motif cell wall anchor domain-containing protein [Agrococcus jejuensis]
MHKRVLSVAALTAVALGSVTVATPAFAADSDIRINEVLSNPPAGYAFEDFVELTNAGAEPVDVSGWILRDSVDTNALVIPDATVIAPGEYLVLRPDVPGGFGLGGTDAARIFTSDGTFVDGYSWTAHVRSNGRMPDGTGAFVATFPTPGAANATEPPAPEEAPEVVINEVLSRSEVDGYADFIELMNVGTTPADLTGWTLGDSDLTNVVAIPAGTTLAPGALLVIEPDAGADGFGLGGTDAARLVDADGAEVDRVDWTGHAESIGRLPDGIGAFAPAEPTPAYPNVERAIDSPVVINEVDTNGPEGDYVELANLDTTNPVDISGWTITDSGPATLTIPEGTEIESGGLWFTATEPSFGLSGNDRVVVRDAEGAVIAAYGWTGGHSPTSFGRCPDMTGPWGDTAQSTPGTANRCGDLPEVDAQPWPFGQTVADAIAPNTFGDDTSGLDLGPDGTLWVVNNGLGELYAMTATDGVYAVDATWTMTYPDGSGLPDSEGVSVVDDGSLLVATERNDDASDVSRPSILRIVAGAEGVSPATHEWNLSGITGPIGANGGPEAVEWISDADAVRLGVVGADGQPYDPAAFGPHLGGIAAVAVESTGLIHLVVLEEDGGITLLQTAQPDADVRSVMSLDWRDGGNELWALCDEVCGNRSSQYAFVDGVLGVQAIYAPPAAMNPSFTNEGLAIQWCEANPAAVPTVLWASDSAHDGISLRMAAGDDCVAAEPEPSQPAPTDPTPTAPTPTTPPVAGDEADDQGGTLPQTGSEGAFGFVALALLLMAAGAVLVGRRAVARD